MNTIQLPDSLVAQLRSYEARLKRLETLAAVAGGIAGLVATYLVLFVADRFMDTPVFVRAGLLALGVVLATWAAHGWARHWLWRRRGPAELARLLQRHFRSLGDRLQGVIELTRMGELPAQMSPALLRAAVRQVAEESSRHDFTQAAPVKPARRRALAAAVIAGLAVMPFLFAPRAAQNAVQRWAMPWAAVERYTFTTLEALPAALYVAHGESFELAVGLREDAVWKPSEAKALIRPQAPLKATLTEGRAVFVFPGQTRDGLIELRVGDYFKKIAVHPLHRPELRGLEARVRLPEYLAHPELTTRVLGGGVDFPEGSAVALVGRISRAVGGGSLSDAGGKAHDILAEGESFVTPSLPVAVLNGEVTMRWQDIHGLAPLQLYKLRIGTKPDAEPRIELQGAAELELGILPHESVRVTLAATDDFGVREMWLSWTGRSLVQQREDTRKGAEKDVGWMMKLWSDWKNGNVRPGTLPPGEMPRIAAGPLVKEITRPLTWSPSELGVPPDSIIELTAQALDYLPGRKPALSQKITVYVLSPEKHAERVRERMDQVLKQLDERIRDEERTMEENQAISENTKELGTEKAAEAIARLEESERANEEALKKLTEQLGEVMKDALRNKDIQPDTIEQWSKIAEALEQKAVPEMQNAQQRMAQAQQSPSQRAEQMQKAKQAQESALSAMREAASKMKTTNENLFARNFYNRLRHAAAGQFTIAHGLKSLARVTAGMKPDEIAAEQRKQFDDVAGRQDGAVRDVESIQEDMTAFLRRISNAKYQAVVGEMEQTRVVAELTELAGFVRANLGLKSVGRAKAWGDQLNAWAEMIQDECNCKGGEGESDPDMMELMIAMVRTAVAQDGIREATGNLDRQKDNNPAYAEDALKLGLTQNQLAGTIQALKSEPKFSKFMGKVGPLLDQVEELMVEVGGELRRPKTDAEILAVQGVIIELLVPPDKKGGSPSEGMAKMQQQMRKMMQQMTRSRIAGGNNSKAASNLAGTQANGLAGAGKSGGRVVEKSGGAANAGDLPEEFRDALQSYFSAIEEK